MTLLAGIVCKNGIVIAADGQTTIGNWDKTTNTNKINKVQAANFSILIAQSGSVRYANHAVRIIQKRAAIMAPVKDALEIEWLLIESLKELRDEQMALYPGAVSVGEWKSFFAADDLFFELLVAYHFEGTPYLFRINPVDCIAESERGSFFELSGSGSGLARYLISEYAAEGMDIVVGTIMAIYTIEKVNSHHLYCSGRTRAGVIRLVPNNLFGDDLKFTPSAVILDESEIGELAALFRGLENESREARNAGLILRLRERSAELIRELLDVGHPIPGATLYEGPRPEEGKH